MNQFLSGFYFIVVMSSKGIVARVSRIVESKTVENVIKVLIPDMIVVPYSENNIKLNIRFVINPFTGKGYPLTSKIVWR